MLTRLLWFALVLSLSKPTIAYPAIRHINPQALQGDWLSVADANKRRSLCLQLLKTPTPQLPNRSYAIRIGPEELLHLYQQQQSSLNLNDLSNSDTSATAIHGLSALPLPLDNDTALRSVSYRLQPNRNRLLAPHLGIKTFYRCPKLP